MTDTDTTRESLEIRRALETEYAACELARPFHRVRYDPGDQLSYDITGVMPANTGRVVAEVEKAVGGGFAGQVYRVRITSLHGEIAGLREGGIYATKILTPPSAFSNKFRNALYFAGYQGAFSAQVNPASVRVGVLWQKLIRRAMAARYGDEQAVCDTFATFFDPELHSHGEINEWIAGRNWKYEVDDQLFDRWRFEGETPPPDHNTPEYLHKKVFMRRLVALLHEMGAPELARQYEWWTLKSQPNVMKRISGGEDPAAGLTAVDFRAGLALLPFLPMSPADGPLILRGLLHGRIVQFDRSDVKRRRQFFDEHREDFRELEPVIAELEQKEEEHRASLPDVTHHHFRLLGSRLRRTVKDGVITGWHSLGHVDAAHAERLRQGWLAFFLLSLIAWVPFFGRRILKLWGDRPTQQHLWRSLTRLSYLGRGIRGRRMETLIAWHRAERVRPDRVRALVNRPVRFWLQRWVFGWLPAKIHRALTEWSFLWQRLRDGVSFAYKFLRVPSFREEWLLDEVEQGRSDGMLSDDEAQKICEQVKDPYIQKYLRCLAVHICTVPVTQIVMFLVGGGVAAYWHLVDGASWVESVAAGTAAGALVQLSPISPGSTARGLFVIYLMIRERDIRNYYIAAPVAFIHVVGYLAFPLQMVSQNPALSRFMAGRWAKRLVHVVPVFGEQGALLEHFVFDLFFNLPLSIWRGFRTRPVAWITGTVLTGAAVALIGFVAYVHAWEWYQPSVRLESVTVRSIAPYSQTGGDLHWSVNGMRVHFDGFDTPAGPVDYPADQWNETVAETDQVDAVIRRSFFGNEYDGLAIAKVPYRPGGLGRGSRSGGLAR